MHACVCVCVCVRRRDLIATPFERDCRLYSVEGLFAMGSALKRVVTQVFLHDLLAQMLHLVCIVYFLLSASAHSTVPKNPDE